MGQFLFAAFVMGQGLALLWLREVSEAHAAAVWDSLVGRGKA
jgi:hypothetical protein